MEVKKEVTIYDLAKTLNYSPSTISRALNNHKSISKKTIKLVKETAEKVGYRPNNLAAGLRNNKSKTIGILVPHLNRPFVSTLISGIEESARKAGYNVLISQSYDEAEIEIANARTLYDSRVSGLIVSLAMQTELYDHFKQFTDQGIPIVFVDRVPKTYNSYKVIIDNYTAGYKATKHLIQGGCKRIAHFAGSQHRNVYEDRKKGYVDALKEHDLPIDESLIIPFKTLSFEEGEKATKKLLKMEQPPDAIFSANDTAAVSAILCAKKMGFSVPEDLAIIGFNDDPISKIVEPALSTISHPALKMGKISAKRILEHEQKEQDDLLTEVSVLNTEVIARASTRPIN
ncbi:LacI family DNA-binding transcriptional regulator [Croceivirga radicis]|uniref:LacI family DNA-binding transcriptional regulator n=1 Tax=Croceivirga radicis TaxID=1929488 RepID=UPI000255AAB8|nr:LacI family DNA-binding transcriptional regulator [Croceivirga radicis]